MTEESTPEPPAGRSEPPPPPRSLDRLAWRPQPMVAWFDPLQLASTGVRALLSSIFGAYADKREVQAALWREADGPLFHDYSDADDFWVDYTADLGDGFDSTYTVAWLLGRPSPPGPDAMAAGEERRSAEILAGTRRGRVLILGGDQVYPTATRDEYANRFSGPYEAALPWVEESERPRMFAVPGNHDWYDGLTSFMRLFCQQRWIGGWQTRQTRSYFAIKLPHRWWLLGTDIQLESDIDKPQLDYFKRVAEHMQEGDRVILCTAEPDWVEVPHDPDAFDNLAYFERVVLCPRGAQLMLTLTGDLHHYARYTDATGERHKITAGGGGAYLYGTHRLPRTLELERAEPGERGAVGRAPGTETFTREQVYPEPEDSLAMRFGSWRLPFRNWRFAAMLGLLYSLYAWFLQGASRRNPRIGELGFFDWVAGQPPSAWLTVGYEALTSVVRDPFLLAFSLLFVVALTAYCQPDVGRSRWRKLIGAGHGLLHLALAIGLVWLIAGLTLGVALSDPVVGGRSVLLAVVAAALAAALLLRRRLGERIGGARHLLVTGLVGVLSALVFSALHDPGRDLLRELFVFALAFSGLMVALGGMLGGLLMALALLPGVNFNEAYSCQHIEGYKSFVRLHVTEQGALMVYPVGIERVTRWEIDPEAQPGEPYFRPRDGRPPRARLIEDPITVPAPLATRVRVPGIVKEKA